MTALYVLAHEYRVAADQLADLDLDAQTVADTLDGLGGEMEAKASNVVQMALNLEVTAAAIKAARAAMDARRKAIENRAAGLRAYVLRVMQENGITKIETPQMALSVRNNPASVDVFDAAQVPGEFMRQPEQPPPEPDKTAIKDALKAGRDVPGCRLTSGVRLEVK